MSLSEIFSRTRGLIFKSKPLPTHGAIIDTSNDTLLTIGTYPPALFFLNETMMDTWYVLEVPPADLLRMKRSDPRSYPEWSWDYPPGRFTRTNPRIITAEMRDRAMLATKKLEAISFIVYRINNLRGKLNTGFTFQVAIYAEKERQARLLKDANFDVRLAAATPYVVQYAEGSGVPLKQAAEEILLQAQLDHEHLAKTEKLRLALYKKVRSATTPEEIEGILTTLRTTGGV